VVGDKDRMLLISQADGVLANHSSKRRASPNITRRRRNMGRQLYRTTDEVGRLKLLIVQIAMILARAGGN
jgi:hypothetical protein